MKKALALVLALVFVFSMSTMAFAADFKLPEIDTSAISGGVNDIVDYVGGLKVDTDIFSTIEDAAVGAIEAISNLDLKALDTGVIAQAIDGFRDALENVGISTSSGTISELFNNLKQKIKDLYCGEQATDPTEPVEAPQTGSSATTGIAVFAAVSVAAAAAYVCTKKKVA